MRSLEGGMMVAMGSNYHDEMSPQARAQGQMQAQREVAQLPRTELDRLLQRIPNMVEEQNSASLVGLTYRQAHKIVKQIKSIPDVATVKLRRIKREIVVVTNSIKIDEISWENVYTIHISIRPMKTVWVSGQNKKSICCHPHIHQSEKPCFGSSEDRVNQFLEKGDIVGLVRLLIEFLRCYNSGAVYDSFKTGETLRIVCGRLVGGR